MKLISLTEGFDKKLKSNQYNESVSVSLFEGLGEAEQYVGQLVRFVGGTPGFDDFFDNPDAYDVPQDEADEIREYIGQEGVITSIDIDNGTFDDCYISVEFDDGFELNAWAACDFELVDLNDNQLPEDLAENVLQEGKWNYQLKNGSRLRRAIHDENYAEVAECLKDCYKELLDNNFIDDDEFVDYTEDFDFIDFEEDDWQDIQDNLDYALSNFYDLCDNIKVWVCLDESYRAKLKEAKDLVDTKRTIANALNSTQAKEKIDNFTGTIPELKQLYIDIINDSDCSDNTKQYGIRMISNCKGQAALLSTLGTFMTGEKVI